MCLAEALEEVYARLKHELCLGKILFHVLDLGLLEAVQPDVMLSKGVKWGVLRKEGLELGIRIGVGFQHFQVFEIGQNDLIYQLRLKHSHLEDIVLVN